MKRTKKLIRLGTTLGAGYALLALVATAPMAAPRPFPAKGKSGPANLPLGAAEQVVRDYWASIAKGDFAAAQDLLTALWRQKVTREQMTEYLRGRGAEQVTIVSVRAEALGKGRAKVNLICRVPLAPGSPPSSPVKRVVYVEQEGARWRICSPGWDGEPADWHLSAGNETPMRAIVECYSKWWKARTANDKESEYALLCPETRKLMSLEEYKRKAPGRFRSGKLVFRSTPKIDGDRARMIVYVAFTMDPPKGATSPVSHLHSTFADLVRTPSGWRLCLTFLAKK
jgi:hypothetical protein